MYKKNASRKQVDNELEVSVEEYAQFKIGDSIEKQRGKKQISKLDNVLLIFLVCIIALALLPIQASAASNAEQSAAHKLESLD